VGSCGGVYIIWIRVFKKDVDDVEDDVEGMMRSASSEMSEL
jgi:hypothetical protein